MFMLTLTLAILLTFTDPSADLGDGTVRQPTAAVGRPNGALDITQFELYDTEAVTFSLSFTSLANPFKLSNGFTFPITEVYIDDQSGTGSATLLPGSGMRLPQGATWKYAFKLTGDTLQIFQATANGWQDVTDRYPTNLRVQGTSIIVSSSLPRPEKLDLYGVVGSYTGFNETGWMPMSRSESPWAYSSDTQIPAALDVIAPTFEAQQNALASGVLPAIHPPRPTNPWIFVMIGGVLVAVLGVMLRFAPNRDRTLAPPYTSAPNVNADTQNGKPKTAHPGPYKPEPLKSRSAALKNMVGDQPTPSLPGETEDHLMPGQLMAAERARVMIASDRKARDTGETLIAESRGADISLDDVNVASVSQATSHVEVTDETANEAVKADQPIASQQTTRSENEMIASALNPLLPTAPRIPPLKVATPTISKPQFVPSEVWQDDEDEFAFLWNDNSDTKEVKTLEPKKQNPEANS
jgi:hypothetical protein